MIDSPIPRYQDENRAHFFINGDEPPGVYYAVHEKHLCVVVAFLESLGCEKVAVNDDGLITTYSGDVTDTDAEFNKGPDV